MYVYSFCAEGELRLETEALCDSESGEVRVSVLNAYSTEFCGVLFDVCYDPAVFIFESAEKCESLSESYELSFCDLGDRVRIIIDGSENCCERNIATINFSFVGSDKSEFSGFSFSDGAGAAYRFVGKGVSRIILTFGQESIPHADEAASVSFVEVEDSREGGVAATFGGVAVGEAFAAGFEVAFISLADWETERVSLLRVLPLSAKSERRFSFTVDLPEGRDFYIAVCPIAYKKDGAELGESKIFAVLNGEAHQLK